eukprot:CAMPEP_0176489430 /NCGR_PEP_ID=MMETSP0200_2-20121128/7283_1 /TAXON_ID=947934 /ORGANISM="Chaetoceros sp., Strain GSL56" /LENGTH=246 /DNA_ID=CAMNT_0017886569 /DNA_START=965 /DNA_END=1706 /DNA_ORIENTATION=+
MVTLIQNKRTTTPKKVVNIKKRITSVLSSRTTKIPTNLCGIKCKNGVYIAWLEKSGSVKEAAYILPFTNAYDKTVNDDNPLELYPETQNSGTILDLWNIDYIMNRREPTREHSNSILFSSKGYPFRCFVWIRRDDGPSAGITLDHWLHNLSEQMMTFVAFTSKNDSLYGKFKWGLNLRVVVEKTVHYAAQDLLDGDVLRIVRDSYDGCDLNELISNDEIRCMYFGSERSAESLFDLLHSIKIQDAE